MLASNAQALFTPEGWYPIVGIKTLPIDVSVAHLLQPDLTTIVNLGYGNPNFGWSQEPADVQTYFGLFRMSANNLSLRI